MKEKRKSKVGRNPKLDLAVYRYTIRLNEEEHNHFLAMFGKSGIYARPVFLKVHFFGQSLRTLKVDKTLVDYHAKLSDLHAQFRAVGTDYSQVMKELRLHFSGKKATASLYKLEQHTVELAGPSRQIMELLREMEAKWLQKSVQETRCMVRLPTTGRRSTKHRGGFSPPTASTMTTRERWA